MKAERNGQSKLYTHAYKNLQPTVSWFLGLSYLHAICIWMASYEGSYETLITTLSGVHHKYQQIHDNSEFTLI